MQTINVQTESQAGMTALQSGNPPLARQHFERIVGSGEAGAHHWVFLGLACKAMDDTAGLEQALDRALAMDPHNLSALIMKGDFLVSQKNVRSATQFYGVAVALASRMELPEAMASEVRRAAEARDRINAHIAAHLRAELAAAGYDERSSSDRFTQSLDILTGRRQPYFQQPRAYFFPELPQVQFYPRADFPWLDAVEAATGDIAAELAEILRGDDEFVPYIQPDPSSPSSTDHRLLNSPDWGAFYLWKNGEPVTGHVERCPKTMAALEGVPLARIAARTPSILFSLLRPGAHIEPHTGFLNTRLICHLPLVVPDGCVFRVGNETRQWVKGKAWVFDDTIEHEAWNTGHEPRVVLIFDVWRPELSEEERVLVARLMEAVDSYSGGEAVQWG